MEDIIVSNLQQGVYNYKGKDIFEYDIRLIKDFQKVSFKDIVGKYKIYYNFFIGNEKITKNHNDFIIKGLHSEEDIEKDENKLKYLNKDYIEKDSIRIEDIPF